MGIEIPTLCYMELAGYAVLRTNLQDAGSALLRFRDEETWLLHVQQNVKRAWWLKLILQGFLMPAGQ
ncbi:MAG: hypothetical protein MZV63_36965 [Marinilabiliales bacterium]|nr:hypothetical protein [Marinilabiliales bacterium]